jgi:hypothetical protein
MLNLSSFDRYRTLENGPFIAVIGLHDRLEKLIDGHSDSCKVENQ